VFFGPEGCSSGPLGPGGPWPLSKGRVRLGAVTKTSQPTSQSLLRTDFGPALPCRRGKKTPPSDKLSSGLRGRQKQGHGDDQQNHVQLQAELGPRDLVAEALGSIMCPGPGLRPWGRKAEMGLVRGGTCPPSNCVSAAPSRPKVGGLTRPRAGSRAGVPVDLEQSSVGSEVRSGGRGGWWDIFQAEEALVGTCS